jgi:putative ABC transport system ATP-binding protein
MELMRELHRGGATICMVTHDPRYAAQSNRVIHIMDGQITDKDKEKAVEPESVVAVVPLGSIN